MYRLELQEYIKIMVDLESCIGVREFVLNAWFKTNSVLCVVVVKYVKMYDEIICV